MDKQVVMRSNLIMPVTNRKFVEKSWQRGADGITLDLEDSIAPSAKQEARSAVAEAIPVAGRGGAHVFVRINNHPDAWEQDLEACVRPGLAGIALPKVESAEEVRAVDRILTRLEERRGLEAGSIHLALAAETARGFLALQAIAAASPRARSLALGTEDFVMDLDMQLVDGHELSAFKLHMLVIAVANGLQPRGLIGSFADYQDLSGLADLARKSYRLGFKGASCIHPGQVTVLNAAFSPDPEEAERALRIVEAYDEALERGMGAISVDGKMVDVPVADKARKIVRAHRAIMAFENHKQQAAARTG